MLQIQRVEGVEAEYDSTLEELPPDQEFVNAAKIKISKGGLQETIFDPAVSLSETQKLHAEYYQQLKIFFSQLEKQTGKKYFFSFRMINDNGNSRHILLLSKSTAEELGLNRNKFTFSNPYRIHDEIKKALIDKIPPLSNLPTPKNP